MRAGELHVVPGQRHVQRRRDEQLDALGLAGLGGARAERAGDEAVGVERHVRAVLLGRPDRDQHGVDAPLDRRLDLGPGHALDEALAHQERSSSNVRHRAILGRHRTGRSAMEGTGPGQRRRALVPGHRRGRAGRPDPRCRASATSTSRRRRPSSPKHFKVVDYDMRGYGQSDRPVQDYDMEVWADDLAGLLDALEIDRGARPRHLDGRDDRDRLRRQVPGADDLGRDQLRRREARAWPGRLDLQELDRHRARWTRTGPAAGSSPS